MIIDAHNRYEICRRRGLSFTTIAMEFADEDAACIWIIRNQFGRRNLAPFTRVELALKLEPLMKKKAGDRALQRNATFFGRFVATCLVSLQPVPSSHSDNPQAHFSRKLPSARYFHFVNAFVLAIINFIANDELEEIRCAIGPY